MAECAQIDLLCRARSSITGTVSSVVESAFEAMCRQFAEAGAAVLNAVAHAFLTASTIDLAKSGVDRVLMVTTGIGMTIAVLLLLGQVIRTGLTLRGEHLAQGIVGVLKAGLATACVASVAALMLVVADQLAEMIMEQTFGSTQAFSDRFANAISFSAVNSTGGPGVPVALLLIFGLLAIIVGAILFGEMLFRHAAIVVIVAVAPIAAAGMVTGSTAAWWRRLVTSGVQLIFLKPLIVLVFAIGFGVAGESDDILGVLAGLATLLLAAFAWPALAHMCTWTAAHAAEAGGVTAFAGGMIGARATQMTGRMMSPQARGSAMDSDRATIARNHAAIDSRIASIPTQGASAASSASGAAGVAVLAGSQMVGRASRNGMGTGGSPAPSPSRSPFASPDDRSTGGNS